MTQTHTSTSATASTAESSKQENQQIKTLWDSIEENAEIYNKLYPQLPENYFDKYDLDQVLQTQPKNPVENAVKKYIESNVKPYIRKVDLNGLDDSTQPKDAWEIGISVDF